jgi:hypothetical protein
MKVAEYLKDTDFIDYAKEQIISKTDEDNLTKEFEPKGLVFSEICSIYVEPVTNTISAKDVRKSLSERGYPFNERQIVKNAKELGFTIIHPHNKSTIKVEGKEKLMEIAKKNNYALEL